MEALCSLQTSKLPLFFTYTYKLHLYEEWDKQHINGPNWKGQKSSLTGIGGNGEEKEDQRCVLAGDVF